ncbi:hypothetical protein DSO57_1011607 [Entomophthora muscae]|uniref:Uncharacterized protein n=1 Tax=Entomophthora muscae TaxID=34485 RepID=A0ACC2UT75_9FUNG|nr:hypothetical protein DSO57_1011607 [Entomophthora muscae]
MEESGLEQLKVLRKRTTASMWLSLRRWTALRLIHSGSVTFPSTGLDNRFKNGWRLKVTAMVNSSSRRVTRRVLKKVQVVIPKRRKHTKPVEVVKAAEKQVVLHDVDSSYLDLGVHLDQLLVPQLALGMTDPLFSGMFLAFSEPREVTGTGLQKGNSIHWWFSMWAAEEYLEAQLKEFQF